MVPTLFFYQPLLIALLWLCLMRVSTQADQRVGAAPIAACALPCHPRSRGLSEHGAFSYEECCIPVHI
jgi:hypothetical protein